MRASSDPPVYAKGSPHIWVPVGCLLQLMVFAADSVTPLGFAHGVLYMPAVMLGLLARSKQTVWVLAVLGVIGVIAGAWVSPSEGPTLSERYVVLNRGLGIATVLLVAWVCTKVLALRDSRRVAHEALEHSRLEWRELAQSLPMMVWVGEEDGSLSFMNRYSAEYLGVSAEQLIGNGWLDFVEPGQRDAVVERWAKAREPGGSYDAEFKVRRADGVWRWHLARAERVDIPGLGPRWYGTAIDVQAIRDEREARLHISNRLIDIMESVTDAIFLLDRDWTVIYVNRHAEDLLGRKREQLLGKNVWDEFPEARNSVFHERYAYSLEHQVEVRFEAEYGPVGKLFEVNAYPSKDGIAVYFHDITHQRRLAEQLQQSHRMDALGQLTGGVAHDFNNLLTVILGNAEMLAEQLTETEQQRMSEMILGASRRAADLTQRLLAFARKQALEPREVDINGLVRDFLPLLEQTLGENVEVEIRPSAGHVNARVDPGQLEVALLNLGINARDAMQGGGRVRIETSIIHQAAGDDENPGLAEGDYVLLSVSDTGQGISSENLKRVFEPFYTTKDVGKGTGLGLAMVYGFARQSNGHVVIDSEPGKGTTVRLYLPKSKLARVEDAPKAPPAKSGAMPRQRILLVDDDDMVRAYAARQVESLGHDVLQAHDGSQALSILASSAGIDLLFTDVVMRGGLSGHQLAEAARQIRPDLPVLYTSGYLEDDILHDGQLDPGVILLKKPYSRGQLAAKLSEALCARDAAG